MGVSGVCEKTKRKLRWGEKASRQEDKKDRGWVRGRGRREGVMETGKREREKIE